LLTYSLSLFDIIISTAYIILIIISIKFFYKKSNLPYNKYFRPFIFYKIFFAIFFVVLHIYVYEGGDTFLYFAGSKFIINQIIENPESTFSFLFGSKEAMTQIHFTQNYGIFIAFNDNTTLTQSQIGAPFAFIAFQQFLCTNILFSLFSASGIWALYSTLCKLYPKAYKSLAIGVLFYPTIAVWGSGLLKDPIVIASIGWIFQSVYNLTERKKVIRSIVIILISISLCLQLKSYVLYTFVPAMLLWLQGRFSKNIKNNLLRYTITPFILVSTIVGGYFFLLNVSESAGKYSLENVEQVAKGFQDWHTYLAETGNQSGYSLGEINFTPLGLLQKTPEAIFVTYYRPRPDEIRNFATAFESIQSTLLLLITIYIIFKVGLITFFRIMFSNKDVRAFMIFAILLGVAVGLTSYNFGALSRYKLPCLPFFTSSLAIIYFIGKQKDTKANNLEKQRLLRIKGRPN